MSNCDSHTMASDTALKALYASLPTTTVEYLVEGLRAKRAAFSESAETLIHGAATAQGMRRGIERTLALGEAELTNRSNSEKKA